MIRHNAFQVQEKNKLKAVVNSRWFNYLVIIVILFGAALVGISVNPSLQEPWVSWINIIDWFILAFFVIEILIRIGAEWKNPRVYLRDPWNIFDILVVAACFIPLKSKAFFVLRLVRILRTFRLFRAFPKLRIIINGMVSSLSSVGYVVILLFLLMYIFAVIGVALFAEIDPIHFGGIWAALFTMFQILTLESWNTIMLPITSAYPLGGPIYFIIFIVLGTMVIMNLILGVIVGNMGKAMHQIEKENYMEEYLDEDAEREALLAKKLSSIERQLELVNKKLEEKGRRRR